MQGELPLMVTHRQGAGLGPEPALWALHPSWSWEFALCSVENNISLHLQAPCFSFHN